MTMNRFLPVAWKWRTISAAAVCLGASIAWTQTPEHGAGARMTDAQIVEDLRIHLETLAAQDRFSGAVLLAKHDQILFENAYGFADHAFDARNNPETRFNLASDGKMFTALAIAQLAEQGKFSLDDSLLKLVPDYPNHDVAAKITIRELLTHRSGLGDLFGPEFWNSNPARYTTLASYLPLFAGKPLLFEPGTKAAYSNAGYLVLGLVIEHVSGESYYQYLQDHIFDPAGMHHTGCYSYADDVPNLALGYTHLITRQAPGGTSQPTPRVTMSLSPGVSAGGCYSTVGDMLRFSDAIEGHKLVDSEWANQLLTGAASDWLGPMTRPDQASDVRVAGHAGGAPGVSTWVDLYPDLGYVAIVLSNCDNGAELVNQRLRWELTGHSLPQKVHVDAAALDDLAGQYKAPPQGGQGMVIMAVGQSGPTSAPPITVRAAGDALEVDLGPMSGTHRFLPLSATEFFDDDAPGARLTFAKDESGRVISLSAEGSNLRIARAPRLP